MELRGAKEKVKGLAGKYRYVLLVLAVGILLMLLPAGTKIKENIKAETPAAAVQQDVARELEQILSQIKGAGQVKVMLTQKSGEQVHYQQDTELGGGDSGSQRQDTVVVTGADRVQNGLIQRVDPPVYLGAVIVCQGADSAAVRLGIIEAVSRITGLGSDRISVLKMK